MNAKKLMNPLVILISVGLMTACSQDDTASAAAGGGGGRGNDSSSGNNGHIGNSQQTGKISADGFYFLFDNAEPEVLSEKLEFTRQEVKITAFADDINDLQDVNGWTVSFKTEWGAFVDDKDSCVLENGSCSVTWASGSPATVPGSCYVAFTAWAVGEEFFADTNDNGLLDSGENFYDAEEPFLDIDESGSYTASIYSTEGVAELIDVANFNGSGGRNGTHDGGNNLYDGSFCASNNSASCSGNHSVVVHFRVSLPIQKRFTDSDDLDGDGDTAEEIRYCGPNPY